MGYSVKQFYNVLGYHTKRKIIVITSDDWGSLRVDSNEARQNLFQAGIDMDSNRFDRFDSLEADSDMERLFDILLTYKDYIGQHPVITAVTNVANPDFEKIKSDNFKHYYYHNLIETHAQYPYHEKVYEYYKKGIELGIFIPQSHGREHLHIKRWMSALQTDHKLTRRAFDDKYFMLNPKYLLGSGNKELDAAFNLDNITDLIEQEKTIKIGLQIFENLFNYRAIYFTAPSEKYNNRLNPTLYEEGIRLIDVPKFRKMPVGNEKTCFKLHYTGQRNRSGQYYITRNAVFEPNMDDNSDGVDRCINDIKMSFKWNKPAIISNHRAAFMGGIDVANRDKGLKALNRLLCEIYKLWPDVEFVSAVDLYNIMAE